MALYKRNKIYWIAVYHNGEKIQQSTGTSERLAAQELHDKIKHDLWQQSKLKRKPNRTWMEASMRWIEESSHKRSLKDDKYHLRWLDPYLRHLKLNEINRELIEELTAIKAKSGASNATINRMLAVIRSILNKATSEWDWIDFSPKM